LGFNSDRFNKDLKSIGNVWKVWKYALGSFADDKTSKYDNVVAMVRTFIFITYLITNCFIISGVIRHWHPRDHNNADTDAWNNTYRYTGEPHDVLHTDEVRS